MTVFTSTISVVHKALVYFTLLGWCIPKKYLPIHLAMWPIIFIHWKTNNDRCILTQLETGEKDYRDNLFVQKLFADYNFHPTDEQIEILTYTLLSVAWLISFYRYMHKSPVLNV